uniref:Uncharacterized protein n=1 Tax=Akkesiphycus lubricus TaxID=3022 RepID=A0A8F0FC24_AKKLU|nr:hypothetical protein [Akkesiphycus lubricus]
MSTPRKRHLRKKRFFLPKQHTFALFNASNLKASKVAKIRLSLTNGKLYSVPLYLTPPKLGAGCPLIMIIYDTLEDLQKNLTETASQIDCLGVSIEKKWYSSDFFEGGRTTNLEKKTLGLLLAQQENLKE